MLAGMGVSGKTLFFAVASPEIAIARVRQRVLEGGHDVPEAVIRRRFDKGWHYFEHKYRELVDEWALYDNSGSRPVLLAEKSLK